MNDIRKYINLLEDVDEMDKKREKYFKEYRVLHKKLEDFLQRLEKEALSKSRFNNVQKMVEELRTHLNSFGFELENNIDFFQRK